MDSFESRVLEIEEIVECCLIAGEWDYSLRVMASSLDDYQAFQLDKLMTDNSEIAAMRSTIIMRKIKATTRLPIKKR